MQQHCLALLGGGVFPPGGKSFLANPSPQPSPSTLWIIFPLLRASGPAQTSLTNTEHTPVISSIYLCVIKTHSNVAFEKVGLLK